MSLYYNYEEASIGYDQARIADGADFMCALFSGLLKKDLSQISVLDAGCGTGNYGLAFLKNGINQLTMIDASKGMLECAKKKCANYKGKVEFRLSILPVIDFPSAQFDVVTFTQVLHHLDSPTVSCSFHDHPRCTEAISQAYRVLKPGGLLLIDAMFDENFNSIWWGPFCPIAFNNMKALRLNKSNTIALLKKCGFSDVTHISRPGACLADPSVYFKIENVSDPKWRAHFSQYKLIESSGELNFLIDLVEKNILEGTLEVFRSKVFENFFLCGDHSMFVCKKY
ncbi:ubiquinone/menaquinone biosynthesis C-methyltransferase UbiE isoform X2 [Hydra vulgaris]|uniref:Ubiquinone/menaquinone biosynthesis C-methyltransferase UbiE isoform X2 n=1 Tax=Hydra vulgaris TaxID=6087 RepID=A0ABM4DJ04_HYDVU